MGQLVLSLIQIYLKWSKKRKNTDCDENREKKLELFVEMCMKYLKGLYDLKRVVSGYEIIKSFERYKAVRTRFTFDFFFERTIWVKTYCPLAAPWFLKIG